MNTNGSISETVKDFASTFGSGGTNSDVTKHYTQKAADFITRNKEKSKTKITERKITDIKD
ncbi:MAG: hypothetical protein IJ772_04490 [Bacilli bacterium]|nr:hypothetical protein [Bacilli bacterium]